MLELRDKLFALPKGIILMAKRVIPLKKLPYMRQAIKDTASVKLGLTDEEITAFREEYAKNA